MPSFQQVAQLAAGRQQVLGDVLGLGDPALLPEAVAEDAEAPPEPEAVVLERTAAGRPPRCGRGRPGGRRAGTRTRRGTAG